MAPSREELIRRFQKERFRLIAFVRALVGDPILTEDIFQEVTVIVLQKAEDFQEGRDLQAWCRGIARNVILRHRADARRLRTFESDRVLELVDAAFQENAERDLVDSRRTQLQDCVGRLAPASREIVDLRYVTGLSLRQIAERLRKTEGAVQVALSRVRKWLTDCARRAPEPAP